MTRPVGKVVPVVAILGGGFTGAAVAYHLARALPNGAARIVVVEPRETLGAGLAYSTQEPAHRINVPAARMSLDSSEPEQFSSWLVASGLPKDDPAAFDMRGVFPQRGLFGRYVAARLAPLLADDRVVHRRARVETVAPHGDSRFDLVLSDGTSLVADILAVATTHPLPALPSPLRPIAGHAGFVADPYDPQALRGLSPDARVLVVGNGLTAADVIATLDRLGHEGPILALSRNGLRSRGHAPVPSDPVGDFVSEPARSALELLGRVRRTIRQADTSWHAVLDAIRNQGGAIWQALPLRQRRKLVRRLRSFWDVHRFRIAPQVEAVLDRLTADGRLRVVAAALQAAEATDRGLRVAFRRRHSPDVESELFDAVVNTTGPDHRSIVRHEPVRSLHACGLLGLDAVGLGLATHVDGHALDRDDEPVPGLYVAGPLARGTFGELMGLPQVTLYAEFVAARIAEELRTIRARAARLFPSAEARSSPVEQTAAIRPPTPATLPAATP